MQIHREGTFKGSGLEKSGGDSKSEKASYAHVGLNPKAVVVTTSNHKSPSPQQEEIT